MFCETCPFFDRTPENIKSVRAARDYQIKKDLEEIEKEQRARAYYQAETDRVWNEYCEQQKKNEEKKYLSAADEYAEYLRLKEKFEKE
jgi:5'-deoxynucleotidase YfbR-like HD superfamily hydrolase